MLVSHDHKFILLRTRKTGSTSVSMFLQPFCTPPNTPVEEWGEAIISDHGIVGQRLGALRKQAPADPGVVRDEWFAHHSAQGLKNKLGDEIWNSYTKISIIRNPFQRAVSSFTWAAREKIDELTNQQKIRRFRRKLRKGKFENDREIVFLKPNSDAPVFVPDRLIRFEHMRDDLEALCADLGLDTTKSELPHTKHTSSKRKAIPLAKWYDEETTAIVRKSFDWVFSFGNYPDTPN